MSENAKKLSLDAISSLCKRRGFIFQTSEIYGGINGFWDYGPLGCELKKNIKETWWRDIVSRREDVVGLDSSIIMHPKVWEASGHTDSFSDPMSTCQRCKKHFRSDDLDPAYLESEWIGSLAKLATDAADGFVSFDSSSLFKWARTKGKALAPGLALVRDPEITLSWLAEKVERDGARMGIQTWLSYLATEQFAATGLQFPCPACGGELTEPREFKMMFETHIGAMQDSASKAYLRPETAQGIFAQFANVLATSRQKIPFGIAQIGKAFRNEINPRNYTFRSREFEQMELEFFVKPGTSEEWHKHWVDERKRWYETIGLPADSLGFDVHPKEKLAHYALACTDITYEFPFGEQELEGIAARGDFDLSQHQKCSGKSMEYFDQEANEKYIPHVIEPSAGVDRIALALICNAYREEWVPKGDSGNEIVEAEPGKKPPEGYEARTVMRFAPSIAPVKVAVFPLLKNKPELVKKAREVFDEIHKYWPCFYDQVGAIGRRYRRQDEVGTPFGITIDFDTLEDQTVTLRERDSMQQVRVKVDDLAGQLHEKLV